MNSAAIRLFAVMLGVTVWCGNAALAAPSPRVVVAKDGRTFATEAGQPYVPMGINYYRPGTGWAPQVWKQFDAEATRRDFERMQELGVNCVRVFLTYGSFFMEPDKLTESGLAKFDEFLNLAEAAGIYVHPTGPDHWEGTPKWAASDRIADEQVLAGLENFWRLFAKRYAGRPVIFAYDLRNEPEVPWDTPALRQKWHAWALAKHQTTEKAAAAWKISLDLAADGLLPIPAPKDVPGSQWLLDYQHFREHIADEWTRRQVAAIKSSDPKALVTVGLIQWSVPTLLPSVRHYSGFRPARQAKFLDFMEVHFYPLAKGAYEYRSDEDEQRNLSYLESVVREVARVGKPVVLAEFGWYGGGQPTFDGGRHPAATGEQQARWCRQLVETTAGMATGWLNWGFYDHPQARDVSELTGLLTVDGQPKPWGKEFQKLTRQYEGKLMPPAKLLSRPDPDWDLLITSLTAGAKFREEYHQSFTNRTLSSRP